MKASPKMPPAKMPSAGLKRPPAKPASAMMNKRESKAQSFAMGGRVGPSGLAAGIKSQRRGGC